MEHPITPRRSRKLVKAIEESNILTMAELPGIMTKPAPPKSIPDDKPVPTPAMLSANDVVQIVSGEHRGVLAQVADFDGRTYRVYRINPPDPPTVFSVSVNDLKFIGAGKVGSRNPLAALAQTPDSPPEMDRPVEERDM